MRKVVVIRTSMVVAKGKAREKAAKMEVARVIVVIVAIEKVEAKEAKEEEEKVEKGRKEVEKEKVSDTISS